jgi:hypothetical protein
MQITVTISDEFAAHVQASGQTPESYVEAWIAEQAASLRAGASSDKLSMEEFDALLDDLARFSDKIPALPIEAFSRESFYQDHD